VNRRRWWIWAKVTSQEREWLQDPAQALRWFRRAADADNTSGMVFLGAMYLFGEGVPVNNEEAARWFQKATNKGNASAMCDLGTLYEHGKGVPKSTSIANQLYRRAAVLGNEEAKKRLAQLASNK
jgi:TPR repeat protein